MPLHPGPAPFQDHTMEKTRCLGHIQDEGDRNHLR